MYIPHRLLSTAVFVLALLFVAPVVAETAGSGTAFARAQHLRHGINASMWFAQSTDYSPKKLDTFITQDDIALIARLGFDHVRISIDAQPLIEWQHAKDGLDTPFITALDKAVKAMIAQHLSVIIDMHPDSGYKATLRDNEENARQFAELWKALGRRFAKTDKEHVFFEILNEPEQEVPARWRALENGVTNAIREVAPDNTIIATGAHRSGIEDLLAQTPLDDDNVIYTFHDYEPLAFTHQGASWSGAKVEALRDVPYPSITTLRDPEANLASQYFLDQYVREHWDAARINDMIAFAGRWSQRYHVPVYCGEFGVYRRYADAGMRVHWIRDTRTALEKNGIGWAMWDYQSDFGVVTKKDGATMLDLQLLGALGLRAPKQ